MRLRVGMIRSGRICPTDSPFRAAPENGVQHVGGDDRRAAAVVSLAGCGGESFEGGSRMFSRSVSAIAAKNANRMRPVPVGS